MKKILLTTTAAFILSTTVSSAFADTQQDTFYLKVNTGWDKLANIKNNSIKYKFKNDMYLGVGVGYYVMDNARFDLTFDHLFNPIYKAKDSKVKGNVNTLLLNGYMDLGTMDAFKFYVGAGLGLSRIGAKVIEQGVMVQKMKAKYNFAYAGHVGVAYELSPGITGELAYSYRVMGKRSFYKPKGHFVGAGVRFDM